MAKKNIKYKKGFGILEVLISGVIIVTILAALVFISRAAMNNSEYLQERATAIYLAQEQLELLRQARDTNWIDGDPGTQWDTLQNRSGSLLSSVLPPDPTGTGRKYRMNYNGGLIRFVLQGPNTSQYSRTTINLVEFSSQITITPIGALIPDDGISSTQVDKADNAFKATVVTTWPYNGVTKRITVSEVLTNWKPNF